MSKYRALIDALEAGPTDGPWLKENGTRITAPNGWMLASAFFTETMPDASEGREPGESWLDARNRLEPERARINAKTEANAAYIAAANPSTIRALLDDLEMAEKALREVVAVFGSHPSSICDTVLVTGNRPETLYDHCQDVLAQITQDAQTP